MQEPMRVIALSALVPTVKILEYKEMELFFVKGESDEP
jgi:hypothetical protein